MTTPSQDGWIERFEAFARSKPADDEYEFWSTDDSECGCAIIQFVRSCPDLKSARRFKVYGDLHRIAGGPVLDLPWTFGALADRLAALRESGK